MLAICEKAVECRAKGIHCDHQTFHEHGLDYRCDPGYCYPSTAVSGRFQKWVPGSPPVLQLHRCLTEGELPFYVVKKRLREQERRAHAGHL